MSTSNDNTDKRLLDQFLIREAHKRGIPIDFKGSESQDQDFKSANKTSMIADKTMINTSRPYQRYQKQREQPVYQYQ